MPRTLSVDLRQRVLDAVAAGATHREAGQRLSVSAASVSRWKAQQRASSTLAPKPRGGDRRSAGTDQHKQAILEALGPDKDRTLEEIREILAQQKIALGTSTLEPVFCPSRHHAQKTYGPPRLQGCFRTARSGLHQRIRSQACAWPRWNPRISGLIKTAASSATFLSRLPRRRFDRCAISPSPTQI